MDSSFFQHIVTRAELYGIPFCHGAGIINIFQQRAVGKGIFCNFRYHAVQIYFFQVGKLRQCIATYAENALVHIHAGDCIALCAPGCSIRCFIVHHHRGFFDIQHTHGDVIFFILVRRIRIIRAIRSSSTRVRFCTDSCGDQHSACCFFNIKSRLPIRLSIYDCRYRIATRFQIDRIQACCTGHAQHLCRSGLILRHRSLRDLNSRLGLSRYANQNTISFIRATAYSKFFMRC